MTKLVFLIGEDASTSYSPDMQNAAFRELSLDALYIPLDVRDGEFKYVFDILKSTNVIGANITMPHKVDAANMVEVKTKRADACGAVNLIYYDNGVMVGDNTDVIALENTIKRIGLNESLKSAVVFGAGGVARAVIYALSQLGIRKVHIFNRNLTNAKKLTEDILEIDEKMQLLPYNLEGLGILSEEENKESIRDLSNCIMESSIIVNATSRGDLTIHDDIVSEVFPKRADIVLCDLVYKPFETKLLKYAKNYGLKSINGLELLIEQALPSFEKWTGKNANKKVILNSLSNSSGIEANLICRCDMES